MEGIISSRPNWNAAVIISKNSSDWIYTWNMRKRYKCIHSGTDLESFATIAIIVIVPMFQFLELFYMRSWIQF